MGQIRILTGKVIWKLREVRGALIDDFGHPYYDGPGHYLAGLMGNKLGVRVRYEKPGTIQRSFPGSISEVDFQEAELVGRAAVKAALNGKSDVMVTLERADDPEYSCSTGLAPLDAVGGKVRTLPDEYMDYSNGDIRAAFIKYLKPLVGNLPDFTRLN